MTSPAASPAGFEPVRPAGVEQPGGADVRLTLPWPHKGLSPNARVHWRRKAELTAKAKREAWGVALAAGVKHRETDAEVPMRVTFCPPDRRRRDRDNAIAACKAMMDGLAMALGVDDSRFAVTYAAGWGEPVKGGAVVVEIAP